MQISQHLGQNLCVLGIDSEAVGVLLGQIIVNSMDFGYGYLLPCIILCYPNSMATALVRFEVDGLLFPNRLA